MRLFLYLNSEQLRLKTVFITGILIFEPNLMRNYRENKNGTVRD